MITVSYHPGIYLVLDEEMDITDKGGAGSNQESTVANVKNSISTGAGEYYPLSLFCC
jgi:hypothetical protein